TPSVQFNSFDLLVLFGFFDTSLEEIEIFIRKHKYLPGVQSRAMIEAEQSWNVSENVRTNLEKI
ncbi:MAG: hypothetical protein ACPH4K_05355, partial [Flavobacteriaceae bacterium]